jgi:hypothetical protein
MYDGIFLIVFLVAPHSVDRVDICLLCFILYACLFVILFVCLLFYSSFYELICVSLNTFSVVIMHLIYSNSIYLFQIIWMWAIV